MFPTSRPGWETGCWGFRSFVCETRRVRSDCVEVIGVCIKTRTAQTLVPPALSMSCDCLQAGGPLHACPLQPCFRTPRGRSGWLSLASFTGGLPKVSVCRETCVTRWLGHRPGGRTPAAGTSSGLSMGVVAVASCAANRRAQKRHFMEMGVTGSAPGRGRRWFRLVSLPPRAAAVLKVARCLEIPSSQTESGGGGA